MTTWMRMGLGVVAVVVALAGTACRQDQGAVVQKALDEAQRLLTQGNADGAAAVLQRAYDTPALASFQPQLLGALIQVHLSANRVEAAQALFLAALGRNATEAGGVVGMIEETLSNGGRFDELADWCDKLRAGNLPEAALTSVAEYHTRALEGAGKTEALLAVLTDYLARLPENAGLSLIERRAGAAVGASAFENAEALIALAGAEPATPARAALATRLRIDLLIARGNRAEAAALFKERAAAVPENAASMMLYRLVQAAQQAGDAGEADALCRFVLDTLKDRPSVRNTAAALWAGNIQGDKPVTVIVDRLTALHKEGFAPEFLVKQIDRLYNTILSKGTAAEFMPLLEFCKTLEPELGNDEDRARLAGIMLDLCFYLEKFADALAIVERGIPGRDAQWTRSLSSKIKAHLALQQGQPREAVTHFRAFMETIAQEQGDQVDPVSGTRVTKDMILGLNAKRIGDILAADGDPEGAAKAYQEARDAYGRALANFSEGTPEYAKITNDVAAIPGESR